HAAHRHADVLPGRSALPARPDLQLHSQSEGSGAPDRRLRPRPDGPRVLDGVPLRHRRGRAGRDLVRTRGRRALMPTPAQVPAKTHPKTPGQTVGPFFHYGTEYEKM